MACCSKSFPQFLAACRLGKSQTAHCRESQVVRMAHNIWKDRNFEIGWLLNLCNHGFSSFLVRSKKQRRNNIWPFQRPESFLLLKKGKRICRLSRFTYLAFFSSMASESPSFIFPWTYTLEAKVPFVCEDKQGKASLERNTVLFQYHERNLNPLAKRQSTS